jgi:predicted peptidase
MPYRLFIPQSYDRNKKYPLVLWLHGGAGRGDDNIKQIAGGNLIGSHIWTYHENQLKNPCFVVAPQCPIGEMWATLENTKPTGQLMIVVRLLDTLRKEFNLDNQRFYVTGQSLGGFGTWAVVAERTDLFAAAIPICGGGDPLHAARMSGMPIWAFHGEKDTTVSVERSRAMIAAIRKAGGIARYTEYKDAGHVIWERAFNEHDLMTWLFAQTKGRN